MFHRFTLLVNFAVHLLLGLKRRQVECFTGCCKAHFFIIIYRQVEIAVLWCVYPLIWSSQVISHELSLFTLFPFDPFTAVDRLPLLSLRYGI
jgi:hypothetical protein